jgi:integrase/recombinase XerC
MQRPTGAAALVVVRGIQQLRPEPALFESMLEGWRRQQESRRLGS